jgi:hypothetical protein
VNQQTGFGPLVGQTVAFQFDSTPWFLALITWVFQDETVSVMVFPPGFVFNLNKVSYDNTGQTLPSWRYLDIGT